MLGLERAGDVDAGVDVSGFLEGGVAGMFGRVAAVLLNYSPAGNRKKKQKRGLTRSRAAPGNPRNLHE